MKVFKIFLLILFCCKSAWAQEKPLVAVSINPLRQIILAVTKDKSNNVLLIKTSFSEHEQNLRKNQIQVLSKADLIFYVSADLENKIAAAISSQKKNQIAFELIKLGGLKLLPNRNNPKQTDLHIWLNPQNAVKIAEFVAKKIAEIDAKNAAQYYQNLADFKKEIHAVEKIIRSQLSEIKGSEYVFFHDGYQYFEDYFGLHPTKIISANHHLDLGLKDFKELDLLAKNGQIKCIFGEKFDEKNTAKKLAQNYKLKFANLDLVGENESYPELLLKISREISGCLSAQIS